MDKNTIKVETKIYESGLIEQTVNFREEIIRYVMDTRKEQIKQALIKLGWIPPKGYLEIKFGDNDFSE